MVSCYWGMQAAQMQLVSPLSLYTLLHRTHSSGAWSLHVHAWQGAVCWQCHGLMP